MFKWQPLLLALVTSASSLVAADSVGEEWEFSVAPRAFFCAGGAQRSRFCMPAVMWMLWTPMMSTLMPNHGFRPNMSIHDPVFPHVLPDLHLSWSSLNPCDSEELMNGKPAALDQSVSVPLRVTARIIQGSEHLAPIRNVTYPPCMTHGHFNLKVWDWDVFKDTRPLPPSFSFSAKRNQISYIEYSYSYSMYSKKSSNSLCHFLIRFSNWCNSLPNTEVASQI